MTAEDKGAIGFATERGPGVSRGIEVVLHRQLCQLALKPGARFEPGFAPGDALCSVLVRGERAKLVQVRNGSTWVEWHGISRIARACRTGRGAGGYHEACSFL